MKKLFKNLLIVSLTFLCLNTFVFADVKNVAELQREITKVEKLKNTNFNSFFNKSEVIGNTLNSFNMRTSEYKMQLERISQTLIKNKEGISAVEKSEEFSDSEKKEKVMQMIEKANYELDQVGIQSVYYIQGVSGYLPSISYNRFQKTFIEYYNRLSINGSKINL